MRLGTADHDHMSLGQKLWHVSWSLVLLCCIAAGIGFAMLYSAAGGDWSPWALRQVTRFGVGLVLMLAVAVTDIRVWMRYSYLL
jgi:rod shape determining protein RodA